MGTGVGDSDGIYYRQFSPGGFPYSETESSVTSYFWQLVQGNPQVVTYAEDQFEGRRFAVFWESDTDDYGTEVYARQIKLEEGLPIPAEWTDLHPPSAGEQNAPTAALLPGGYIAYAFQGSGQSLLPGAGYDIFYNVIGPDGAKVSDVVQKANQFYKGDQHSPTVATIAGVGFAIAWESDDQDGFGAGIYARRFDGEGFALGQEFRVNCETYSNQSEPVAAGLPGGGFVVGWTDRRKQEDFTFHSDIALRLYDGVGQPTGSAITANGFVDKDQTRPAIASVGSDFIMTWNGHLQTGSNGNNIYLQRFSAKGVKVVP
jgi:hypothetical protein